MKNKKFYIIVSDYSMENSKRQPWYSVKHLKEVILKGQDVNIVASFDAIVDEPNNIIIKFWSMKDLFFKPKTKCEIIYLMSFPIYSFTKLLRRPVKVWQNRKDLWKIFIVSFVPKFWLVRQLEKAEKVIFISDRSFEYLGKDLTNSIIYYPYFKGNWGNLASPPTNKVNENLNVGYFGPPFSSRGIDDVISLINKVNHTPSKLNFKLIIRTERKELELKLEHYKHTILHTENVEIVDGFLTRDNLYDELQKLDIIILPFSFVFSELPIVVLEAIELNKLVLTTEDSGLQKVVEGLSCCELIEIKNICSENDLWELYQTKFDKNDESKELLFNKIDLVNNLLRGNLCQN